MDASLETKGTGQVLQGKKKPNGKSQATSLQGKNCHSGMNDSIPA